jgi:hypothetical protein
VQRPEGKTQSRRVYSFFGVAAAFFAFFLFKKENEIIFFG